MMQDITIRFAEAGDAEVVLQLVRDLAAYENRPEAVTASVEDIEALLFGEKSTVEALLAEVAETPVGFALFFPTVSTFRGRPKMYLEDLYVQDSHRGNGIGRRLLERVAQLAIERSCIQLEWSVLNWNQPAIAFYKSLGAEPMDAWTHYGLAGKALEELAHPQV